MTNFNKTAMSPVVDGPKYGDIYNSTWASRDDSSSDGTEQYLNSLDIVSSFILSACIIGLVGNGTVICLLVFHIKRSPFMTYILNLAVADFGLLLFGSLHCIFELTRATFFAWLPIIIIASSFMYDACQFLLTAISIDRCVSVLFPIWHRCHRPPYLPTVVCALMWVLACLPSGTQAILYSLKYLEYDHLECLKYHFLLFLVISGSVVCLPLVTTSAVLLLSKVVCKSQQPRRGKILTIVLLSLLFFLIFAFPLNATLTLSYFTHCEYEYLIQYGFLCACLNSCVNPVIYYMVGRKKWGQQKQSMKVILQRAFKEEEELRRT